MSVSSFRLNYNHHYVVWKKSRSVVGHLMASSFLKAFQSVQQLQNLLSYRLSEGRLIFWSYCTSIRTNCFLVALIHWIQRLHASIIFKSSTRECRVQKIAVLNCSESGKDSLREFLGS